MALQPLYDGSAIKKTSRTIVLFINDVAACAEDLLELVLPRRILGTATTCAMDWTFVGAGPTFYDVWVARGPNGDSFFNTPVDGSWVLVWDLFWNDAQTRARFDTKFPFQNCSCWNGAAAFLAAPLLDEEIRSRESEPNNCQQGQTQNFSKDLWLRGYGKTAVVPTVNLEYSSQKGQKIKKLKGYVSNLVQAQDFRNTTIDWVPEPPKMVKCVKNWHHQRWRPWRLSR